MADSGCGLVLAHARSGSSEFIRAISDAVGHDYLMEPFHRKMKERGIEYGTSAYNEYLDEVMSSRLVKHMWNGMSLEANSTVLQHSAVSGVVFLYRRNVHLAALSAVVAQMTGKWRGKSQGSINENLPLSEIEKRARFLLGGQKKYRDWLADNEVPHLVVAYEDFFGEGKEDVQERVIKSSCSLFGLEVHYIEKGLARLSPEVKYNSDDFYKTAPNWNEFERRFLLK